MSVVITEKAAKEIQRTMAEQDRKEAALRVGVSSGGCNGYNYVLVFDEDFDENNDQKTEQHGVTVIVDKKSALFLDGTMVDYIDGIDKRGFSFSNPKATRTCGCGSSFQV